MTQALINHVVQHENVSRVIAHTTADNGASKAVLRNCGFVQATSTDQPGALLFQWTPDTSHL
jgi:RimJ/RimL family protein N-acetyltransferase